MKKFIARGALVTMASAVAILPLAGVSQADAPRQDGPQAVTTLHRIAPQPFTVHRQAGYRDECNNNDRRNESYRHRVDGFAVNEAVWSGDRDGYGPGFRHHHKRNDHRRCVVRHHRRHRAWCPWRDLLGI